MRSLGWPALLALGCWLAMAARAQDAQPEQGPPPARRPERPPPGPDLDFLEYLGAWAGDDDEWLAIEEWEKDNDADEARETPDGKRDDGDENE